MLCLVLLSPYLAKVAPLFGSRDIFMAALLGVVLALGAVAVFVRVSLTRWFRYWLVRLIYENRAQTDALRDAIEDPSERD